MKTVLMISPYFVPRRRVGALRPFKFAIHLRSHGYKPVVLTIGNPDGELTERERTLLKDIEILKINPPFDRTNQENPEGEPVHKSGTGFGDRMLNWIDKQTPTDTWIYLFKARYSWIYQKVKEINPDLIWATGDPWSGLWLGEKLSKEFSKPFVADFRDPWTLATVNVRNRSSFSFELDQKYEKKVVKTADKLTFTSKLAENKYADFYQLPESKTTTIYNSFDCTITRQPTNDSWTFKPDPDYLNMIFFGRFRRLSPVTPIADALKILKNSSTEQAESILIHSFGQPDADELSSIKQNGLEQNFVFHEPVVPEKMPAVLKSADILLLSTNIEREEIIPAKLWDYLSVEVPIFSLAPNPEVSEIIMRSKAGIQVHPDHKNEIAELLGCFAIAKKNDRSLLSVEEDLPDRKIYEASQTAKQLAHIFDDLINNA